MNIKITSEDVQERRLNYAPIVNAFKREFPFATYIFVNNNEVVVGWHDATDKNQFIRYFYPLPDTIVYELEHGHAIQAGDYNLIASKAIYAGTREFSMEDYK